jgi:hypothetical protein
MHKIIFLDIDGVLNKNGHAASTPELNSKFVSILSKFVNKHDIKIVLSSSWRIAKNRVFLIGKVTENPYEIIENKFSEYGMKIFDVTPIGKTRGKEIETWLLTTDLENVEYAILDDYDDFLQYQKSYWVKVNSNVGLSENDISKLARILNV